MSIKQTTIIKINSRNKKYFKELGYGDNKMGVEIIVDINHLQKTSRVVVTAWCDVCEKEVKIPFLQYYKNTNGLVDIFCCDRKCLAVKIEKTCMEKYGGKAPACNKDVQKKIEQTNFKKYGTKAPAQNETVLKKMKKTCVEKFGTENAFQNEEIKEKIKKTCLEKYGKEYYTQTKEYRESYIKYNLEKHGVEHFFSSEYFKEYIKNYNLEKHGVEYYSQSDEFVEKMNKHRLEGLEEYNKIVRTKSRKQYKKLKLEWNGYDYYTGEYIKDSGVDSTHPLYPCVDHKISIKYGFENGFSIEEISCYNNLCITTRRTNSIKNIMIEEEFKKTLN